MRQRQAQAIGLDGILDVHRGRAEVELAAADRRLRGEDANLGHQIVVDLALDRQRRLDIDLAGVRAQVVELGLATSPCAACASASATHTARQSRRRVASEKSARSSARPYLHENGEA